MVNVLNLPPLLQVLPPLESQKITDPQQMPTRQPQTNCE